MSRLVTETVEPIINCRHRHEKNSIMCELFGMSCAMFHTRIGAHPIRICVYREEKIVGGEYLVKKNG
jgi:hypothetical protein